MRIDEPPGYQRADEIESQCRALVPSQHELRIGRAGLGGELRTVDQVPAVVRQRYSAASLEVGRPRFRVLAREPADAHNPLLGPVYENQAHLQQDLQLVRNGT